MNCSVIYGVNIFVSKHKFNSFEKIIWFSNDFCWNFPWFCQIFCYRIRIRLIKMKRIQTDPDPKHCLIQSYKRMYVTKNVWNKVVKKKILRDDVHFADVTLACEGHSVKAHRIILCACSSYFQNILKSINPAQHPVLLLPDVRMNDLTALMDFIYFGEVIILIFAWYFCIHSIFYYSVLIFFILPTPFTTYNTSLILSRELKFSSRDFFPRGFEPFWWSFWSEVQNNNPCKDSKIK